jgi:deoxyribonuclease-4
MARIRDRAGGQGPSRDYDGDVARLRFGPARIPSRESAEAAVEALLERSYDACEIDFESGFWMDYPWAERLGELARDHDLALSVHAPLFGFMGHVEASGRKFASAVGALDRSAGIAKASGAEPVVFHPGFLLERSREAALDAVVEQLTALRERLASKDRAVPFGVEVMGRVRDLGSLDDVLEIARRTEWVRPVLDFAHMHATSDGAYVGVEPFAAALAAVDDVLEPGAPFHIHFSDIAYANRNETKHLPYGEGTLRAEPLGEALAGFDRPATVISESPDEASSQAIRAALSGVAASGSTASASSPRPRSRRN